MLSIGNIIQICKIYTKNYKMYKKLKYENIVINYIEIEKLKITYHLPN